MREMKQPKVAGWLSWIPFLVREPFGTEDEKTNRQKARLDRAAAIRIKEHALTRENGVVRKLDDYRQKIKAEIDTIRLKIFVQVDQRGSRLVVKLLRYHQAQ